MTDNCCVEGTARASGLSATSAPIHLAGGVQLVSPGSTGFHLVPFGSTWFHLVAGKYLVFLISAIFRLSSYFFCICAACRDSRVILSKYAFVRICKYSQLVSIAHSVNGPIKRSERKQKIENQFKSQSGSVRLEEVQHPKAQESQLQVRPPHFLQQRAPQHRGLRMRMWLTVILLTTRRQI